MKFAVYSNYKSSGAEWLGDVPDHWSIASLRWASRRYTGGTPDRSNDAYWDEGRIPWVNSGAVNQALISEPSAYITDEAYANSSAKWVPKGALVMALAGQGKTKGTVAQLGIDTTCNQSMAAIIPDGRLAPRFLYWWLSAQYDAIRNMAGGEQRDGLNLDILGSIPVALFPIEEQVKIAEYLDRETAKIDALVAKKQQLIEKLKEKRAALISCTVTRGLPPDAAHAAGLNPNPRLKPSGIDWLGDVPRHWNVKPLKHVIQYVEGPGIMATDFVDEGIPLLRIAGITTKVATLDGCNYLLPERVQKKWAHFRVRRGDLLISGSASTGFCAEVDDQTVGAIPYTGIIITRPRAKQSEKDFIRWFFLSSEFLIQAQLARTGSTIQHFGPSHLAQMVIAQPPLPEQAVIANYLGCELTKIDALVAKVHEAVGRLQEYRTALIAAGVTGKLDVRKEAA